MVQLLKQIELKAFDHVIYLSALYGNNSFNLIGGNLSIQRQSGLYRNAVCYILNN